MRAFRFIPWAGALAISSAMAYQVTLQPHTRHQGIVGFGAGTVYYQNWLTAHEFRQDIYDTMFTGLGISLLRLGNWNQDESATLEHDSTIVAEARQRLGDRFQILISSWSAPASLKANNNVDGKGFTHEQNTLKKVNGEYVYDQFASWWRRSIEKYRSKGMDPDFITIQNEPDMNADYEGTIFLPTSPYTVYINNSPVSVQTATYPEALKAVHDTLSRMSDRPAILGPEVLGIGYSNFRNYVQPTDTSLLDGYAFHLYHGNEASGSNTYEKPDGFNDRLVQNLSGYFSSKPSIMTEFCPMRDPIGSDLVASAQIMQNMLTKGQINGYISWELMWKENGQMAAIENPWEKSNWTSPHGYFINPEYHSMRHFSRFVSPGWDRVSALSPDTNLRVVAFANPQGDSLTLVAIHLGNSVQPLHVAPTGYHVSQVWQSSTVMGTENRLDDAYLSQRLTASADQNTFELPAQSITTIVWTQPTVALSSQTTPIRTPTTWRIYDAMGQKVSESSHKPLQMPRGLWIVESLDAQGHRIMVQKTTFH